MPGRSRLARPNICRLSILILWTWPSIAPELSGSVSPAVTVRTAGLRFSLGPVIDPVIAVPTIRIDSPK